MLPPTLLTLPVPRLFLVPVAFACLALAPVCPALAPVPQADEYKPKVEAASGEAAAAIAGFEIKDGFVVELFAAEPHLANPVAFTVDHSGRFYVAETFRHSAGVTDTRSHMAWLGDDLACRTVEDRIEMLRRRDAKNIDRYATEHDRVRRIVDVDGDGLADLATVFSDGYREIPDGIGAGLLARGQGVFYTCIPDLWYLRDDDDDGRAESKTSLHTGYGVHINLLGHDLHGLCLGYDGRLYFSIGDRGHHIRQGDRVLSSPDTGSVFRCELDGSNLEVFATGLRNPQELVFDEYGNLFTGDNNSDGGDRARFVYLVEGGDSGWRIGYQWLEGRPSRGPWNEEKLWHPAHEGQAAYLVPPLANVAAGPSGLTYHPGTGLGSKMERTFFLCDFRGNSKISGVYSFGVTAKGAGFEVGKVERFFWKCLVTDVDFGPDGNLYVSDWVDSWNKTGKGRIYRIRAAGAPDHAAAHTEWLLNAGFAHRDRDELLTLLGHPDRRVRIEAQMTIASRTREADTLDVLRALSINSRAPELARIHALWTLAQIHRHSGDSLVPMGKLAADPNPEIRAQYFRVVGDLALAGTQVQVVNALRDRSPRVRMFAGIAAGKLGHPMAFLPLLQMLRENTADDRFVRHGAIMGLTGIGDHERLLASAGDPNAEVRTGVLVSLRRLGDPRLARFLNDPEAQLVVEAARAIHDLPLESSLPQLAALSVRQLRPELNEDLPLLRRVLNAGYRIGSADSARGLADYSLRQDAPESMRVFALQLLSEWQEPGRFDKVTNAFRPLEPRSLVVAKAQSVEAIARLLENSNGKVLQAAARTAGVFELRSLAGLLRAVVDSQHHVSAREAALRALAKISGPEAEAAVAVGLVDPEPRIRIAAREALGSFDPVAALAAIDLALERGEVSEKQGAFDVLAGLKGVDPRPLLITWLDRLTRGEVPPQLHLELVEAATARPDPALEERLASWRATRNNNPRNAELGDNLVALHGGEATRGRTVFFEKVEAQCLRCHKIGTEGVGVAGPDLAGVADRHDRLGLLESLVLPNKVIAEGYHNEVFRLKDGQILNGKVVEEDETKLKLLITTGTEDDEVMVEKSNIDRRRQGLSSMPANMPELLTPRELRDVVEFLSTLKGAPSGAETRDQN